MHIGAAIRHTRETLRLKLEMVALDAGFDPGNLSRIETGRQNPSIPRLEAIAKAMDVTVADLYALVEPPRTLVSAPGGSPLNARGRTLDNSEWVQLRCAFEGLDARRRHLTLEFMQMLNRLQGEERDAAAGAEAAFTQAPARRAAAKTVAPLAAANDAATSAS
ncbi:helix-turn-helix domain-containing protein [Verticiella sediminum]|nr:helix-turn-helix transcriptional regulator [Verticiella sediminum]